MSATWNPMTDMPSLKDKVAVITGGNAGIGLSSVKYLATKGAKVYFTARSADKAQEVRDSIKSSNPDIDQGQLAWLPMDLTDLKSVVSAVEELKRLETKVHILINNAGVVTASTDTAGPGWELHMAVNHVGHFVFTNGVLPLLKTAAKGPDADVRIVTVSSDVNHVMFPPSYKFAFDDPSFLTNPVPYYPWQWRYVSRHVFVADMVRYAASKVANLLFAQELQRVLDEQGLPILSISVHPGGTNTEGCRNVGGVMFSLAVKTFLTSDQGAVTPLYAATSTEVRENADRFGGKYLEPFGEIRTPHPVAKDVVQVSGMWNNTTKEVNRYLAEMGLSPLDDW